VCVIVQSSSFVPDRDLEIPPGVSNVFPYGLGVLFTLPMSLAIGVAAA
jgi:hypothetical protein